MINHKLPLNLSRFVYFLFLLATIIFASKTVGAQTCEKLTSLKTGKHHDHRSTTGCLGCIHSAGRLVSSAVQRSALVLSSYRCNQTYCRFGHQIRSVDAWFGLEWEV
jgi:hypothetical protein